MKILFLAPYPIGNAPSQRFRFEQYFSALKAHNIEFVVQSFLDSQNWQVFSNSGWHVAKAFALSKGILKRVFILFKVSQFDFVMIHREATPLGPPAFEWVIARILRKRIIYDFDDAIWRTDNLSETWLAKKLRWRQKVQQICRWSAVVSCGNEYLADYASHFNEHVIVNPTTIDTLNIHNPAFYHAAKKENFVIGWTGSHSTLKYLEDLAEVLQRIQKKYPTVTLLVIADKKPELNGVRLSFSPWSVKTEISDLLRMDIGVMPLPADEWTKGKCGFKALQYMAMEIPALVSPVGVNTAIVRNGVDGYWCSTSTDWYEAIESLINDARLRKQMGNNGRQRVVDHYSVSSNTATFLSLFQL